MSLAAVRKEHFFEDVEFVQRADVNGVELDVREIVHIVFAHVFIQVLVPSAPDGDIGLIREGASVYAELSWDVIGIV